MTRWKSENPWAVAAYQTLRECNKRMATPPWVDIEQLKSKYKEAHDITKRTGIKYSVDHIYPLMGKNSCGLHVPANLQVIPLLENISKGNKNPEEWGGYNRLG